ncbi:MAG TPA: hypothetical protein VFZ37_03120 [Jiangellaceae bacterium]
MRLRDTAPTRGRRARVVEYTIVGLTILAIIATAAWLVGTYIMSP